MQSFSAGLRIAAPVCALVRNDMQKEGRVRGCKDAARNDMQKEGRVHGSKNVARNDMQKEEALLRLQGRFPAVPSGERRHPASFCLSLRGAKRRGNP